jgi:hypothetical protein
MAFPWNHGFWSFHDSFHPGGVARLSGATWGYIWIWSSWAIKQTKITWQPNLMVYDFTIRLYFTDIYLCSILLYPFHIYKRISDDFSERQETNELSISICPLLPPLLAVSVADVRQGYVPTSLCRLFVRLFAIACKQRFLKHWNCLMKQLNECCQPRKKVCQNTSHASTAEMTWKIYNH